MMTVDAANPETTKRLKAMRARAEEAMKGYPQYKGAFANHKLCLLRRTITTKGGLSFVKDEEAIYDPLSLETVRGSFSVKLNNKAVLAVWSMRRMVYVSVFVDDLLFESNS